VLFLINLIPNSMIYNPPSSKSNRMLNQVANNVMFYGILRIITAFTKSRHFACPESTGFTQHYIFQLYPVYVTVYQLASFLAVFRPTSCMTMLFWAVTPCRLAGRYLLKFSPEDGDSMFLRNVGIYLQVYTASRLRTSLSSPP
jgi:hypothetical protein